MQSKKAVIIDYGIGNLHSVLKACEQVGLNALISKDKEEIRNADAIILPGVGAFPKAMKNLEKYDLIQEIKDFAQTGKIIMGVCLGMQLLMTNSEEFGLTEGLGLIDGTCLRFSNKEDHSKSIKVPQIMWNKIFTSKGSGFEKNSPLSSIKEDEFMYFVHSYYVKPSDEMNILSLTNYCGVEYASSVRKNNIFGFQFHPEKSGDFGLEIYKNLNNFIKK